MAVDWTDEAEAVEALRGRGVETDITDLHLHSIAKAAVEDIAAAGYGPKAAENFVLFGSMSSLLSLPRPASAVSSVVEEGVTLTAGTHYRLRPGGLYLERIVNNYPSVWYGRITGTIAAEPGDEQYDRVVRDLVLLTLQFNGLDSRRDGDYAEESLGARGGGQQGYETQRQNIIAALAPADGVFA